MAVYGGRTYLLEVAAGKGRLLVTSFNVRNTYDGAHPEAVFLVDALFRYAQSDAFARETTVVPDVLRRMLQT